MARPKPLGPWSRIPDRDPSKPYTKHQLTAIIGEIKKERGGTLGKDDEIWLRSALQFAAGFYISRLHYAKKRGAGKPTRPRMAATLKRVSNAAKKLHDEVMTLDDVSVFALLLEDGVFKEAFDRWKRSPLGQLREPILSDLRVDKFAREAQEAASRLDKPRAINIDEILNLPPTFVSMLGSPIFESHRTPIDQFIHQLADIFMEFSGRDPMTSPRQDPTVRYKPIEGDRYVGVFKEFAEACIEPVDDRRRQALGRTIYDALRSWDRGKSSAFLGQRLETIGTN